MQVNPVTPDADGVPERFRANHLSRLAGERHSRVRPDVLQPNGAIIVSLSS
jgi:hypothetical protein